MKVIVTGGSGHVGRYVVDDLEKSGYEVSVFDIKGPRDKDVDFVKGNILNADDCRKAFRGAEAIVHLAAIPNPLKDSPDRVFTTNVGGTFNIHQAAADLGIEKVVQISSDSSYGFNFRREGDVLLPEYLPIDEDHPQKPADPYGLSKKIGEEIAKSFVSRYGMKTIALRICGVAYPEPGSILGFKKLAEKDGRPYYNDVRDVAFAIRLALEAKDLKKYEVFCISAADNAAELDSLELSIKLWGNNIPFTKEIKDRESLYDWTRARVLLGYRPRHTWRSITK
ncbi:MAG: NAD(P)-dependent oxidoreductase [Actinomycetia bacterium]|nr:NAD(P)-dependent oxidoreductase [Actinomycetes bacterium]